MNDDAHYATFKAGDVTYMKGRHIFLGAQNPAIPAKSKVRVQERDAAWSGPGEVPHVVVEYWDGSEWTGSNWIQEDCLESLAVSPEEIEAAIRSIEGG